MCQVALSHFPLGRLWAPPPICSGLRAYLPTGPVHTSTQQERRSGLNVKIVTYYKILT